MEDDRHRVDEELVPLSVAATVAVTYLRADATAQTPFARLVQLTAVSLSQVALLHRRTDAGVLPMTPAQVDLMVRGPLGRHETLDLDAFLITRGDLGRAITSLSRPR